MLIVGRHIYRFSCRHLPGEVQQVPKLLLPHHCHKHTEDAEEGPPANDFKDVSAYHTWQTSCPPVLGFYQVFNGVLYESSISKYFGLMDKASMKLLSTISELELSTIVWKIEERNENWGCDCGWLLPRLLHRWLHDGKNDGISVVFYLSGMLG